MAGGVGSHGEPALEGPVSGPSASDALRQQGNEAFKKRVRDTARHHDGSCSPSCLTGRFDTPAVDTVTARPHCRSMAPPWSSTPVP